jgi:uncharacterized protein YjbJ (UPF0337 family)
VNKDQAKGHMKDIGGKIQEKAGEITGSPENQVKGKAKQVEGKMQKGVGDAKNIVSGKDNPGSDK